MSLLDDVSIVVTPNGVKASKLYAVIPSNGDADMDVTRATAATRVDEDGLVNYAEVIGSELVTCGDFSCAAPTNYWTATNAVISFANNQLTVDDTAGAGGDSRGSQVITTESGKTYRLTFNRISTTSLFYVGVGGGTSYNNIFYSSLGTDTGEYTLEFTATSSSSIIAFISGGNGITVFSNISVKEVTRDNVPRIDYTGGGCPHILAEPQRTNLITYSETFSDSSWSKINSTLSSNTTSSPSGDTNASTIVSTSATNEQYLDVGSLSVTSGDDYTMSCFVKKKDYDFFLIRFTGVGGAFSAGNVFFNINSGALGTIDSGYSGTITDFGNGWYKCTATTTASGTTGSAKIRLQLASADNNETITGDGSSGTFIWGSQFEESYATSYIPTSGSTVTRNQDIFTRDGIGSLINSTEGTIFVEMAALANDSTNRYISINDGSSTNRIIFKFGTSSNNISALGLGTSTSFSLSYSSATITNMNKIALKYKVNDCALWVNGVEVATDTTFTAYTANTLNQINFSNYAGSGQFLDAKVKQLQVYTTALTDEQLTSLTS